MGAVKSTPSPQAPSGISTHSSDSPGRARGGRVVRELRDAAEPVAGLGRVVGLRQAEALAGEGQKHEVQATVAEGRRDEVSELTRVDHRGAAEVLGQEGARAGDAHVEGAQALQELLDEGADPGAWVEEAAHTAGAPASTGPPQAPTTASAS